MSPTRDQVLNQSRTYAHLLVSMLIPSLLQGYIAMRNRLTAFYDVAVSLSLPFWNIKNNVAYFYNIPKDINN